MDIRLTYAAPDPEKVAALSQQTGCHPVVAGLLVSRGLSTPETVGFFLDPTFEKLRNPFSLKDMDKAVDRIYTAFENREKILVFGDFDADGVTATSLVCDFLTHAGADVAWYIPHRLKEGYSLHPPHIEMAAQMDIDLIITVDCGIGAVEAVEQAALEDIDVIVTDHHEPGGTLPKAAALVNPKQADCSSGLDYLAGVGVAFYLVMALRRVFREKGVWETRDEPSLLTYLDLFAIGTIGDMVPLVDDNRVLCLAGIRRIRQGSRPGIRALARACRMDPDQLDSDDISFKLVPRINAAGRIAHARICVSHLTAATLADAQPTATLLEDLNIRRQQIEREIVLDIENRIARDPSLLDLPALVLWDRRWQASVLGIAASRLSKKYSRPVVLLAVDDDTATGSCRSINQLNIHQALSDHTHLLEKFGGHAMAAGLTLSRDNLDALKAGLADHFAAQYSDQDFQKATHVDAVLGLEEVTVELAREIGGLRPFGTANPEPVFLCRRVWVADSHIIGNSHRKMMLKTDGCDRAVEAFHFNIRETRDLPVFFEQLLFKLKVNKFRPHTPQMIVQDI